MLKDNFKESEIKRNPIKETAPKKGTTTKIIPLNPFWVEETKGKGDKAKQVLVIKSAKLIDYLSSVGFKQFRNNYNDLFLIKDRDNIVSRASGADIRTYITNEFIDGLPEQITGTFKKEHLRELLISGIHNYISGARLDTLEFTNFDMLRDTRDKSYFFFRNCFVEVTKNGIEQKDYKQLEGKIWDTQLIQHDFYVSDQYTDLNYIKFIENITGKQTDRKEALESVLAYLLSNYNDKSNPVAIVFKDASISKEATGRTGKGLLSEAIGMLRKKSTINGKSLDTSYTFAFHQIQRDTQIALIDDVRKKFDFRSLYSYITEGYKVQKKGKETLEFDFENNPKTVINTNYDVNTDDESSKARIYEMELENYYNSDFTPFNEFKELFFNKEYWSPEHFNKFYTYLFDCLATFLQNDRKLLKYNSDTLIKKKLLSKLSPEIIEFLDDCEANTQRIDRKTLFAQYLCEISVKERSFYTTRKFKKEVENYCLLKNKIFTETKTNGKTFFRFV